MWSYFTSHTRSIRSGSHERSFPALQRLWPPGMRVVACSSSFGPFAPGMFGERVLAQRLELCRELLPPRHRERRGDADVVQAAVQIVESEQQRADERCLSRSCANGSRPRRSRRSGRASP